LVKSLSEPYPDVLALVKRNGSDLPTDALRGADWTLTDSTNADRLRKMDRAGIPLGQYVNKQIFRGVLTGFNDAFIITGKKRAELIAQDPNSVEIIKPLAVGKDIQRWGIAQRDVWLIVTKIGVDMARYPAVMEHLCQWQPELEKRTDQGNHWWELRACAYYAAFDKPKIIYPEVAISPRFTLDLNNVYPLKTCFVIDSSDLYLLGVLNSESFISYQREKQNTVRGGYMMNSTIYVGATPIPNATSDQRAPIALLVQKCLDAKGVGCEAWEAEINTRVEALYGL
jgi:hypothetical protein